MLLNENLPRSMPEVRAASLESVPCSGYLSPQGDFDARAILSMRGWSALKISVAAQILHDRADDVIELRHPRVRNRPAEASIGVRAHVRFLSLADKTLCRRDFRFVPKADIRRGKWNVR